MVSASFQIFALTAGGMSWVGREIAREGELWGICAGGMPRPMSYTRHDGDSAAALQRLIRARCARLACLDRQLVELRRQRASDKSQYKSSAFSDAHTATCPVPLAAAAAAAAACFMSSVLILLGVRALRYRIRRYDVTGGNYCP